VCDKFEVIRRALEILLLQSQWPEVLVLVGHSQRQYERVCCQGIGTYSLKSHMDHRCISGLELSLPIQLLEAF
jgi:hypothetical protein